MRPPASLLSALARTAAQPSRAQLRRHSAAVMPGTLAPGTHTHDPFQLTHADLKNMVGDIHAELDTEIRQDSELREMAKYYFDGKGKAIRPVIALCLGHAFNHHTGAGAEVVHSFSAEQISSGERPLVMKSIMVLVYLSTKSSQLLSMLFGSR